MAHELGFAHSALIVDSERALTDRLVPALERSLAEGMPVLMLVGPAVEEVVRDRLGAGAAELQWNALPGFYQRLGVTFETFRRYLAAQHAEGRTVHVVAEPPMTGKRAVAFLPFESVCNLAYAGYGCPITCLWDSRRHSPEIIDDVAKVHPFRLEASGLSPSTDFLATDTYLSGLDHVPPEPPPPVVELDEVVTVMHDLPLLRANIRRLARTLGFAVDDLTLATNEVVTNGLAHGAPPVRVRAWRSGDLLAVQVEDHGGVPVPPGAGYLPPEADQFGGRGMWIARQLADIVSTHSADGKTLVRMVFPRW